MRRVENFAKCWAGWNTGSEDVVRFMKARRSVGCAIWKNTMEKIYSMGIWTMDSKRWREFEDLKHRWQTSNWRRTMKKAEVGHLYSFGRIFFTILMYEFIRYSVGVVSTEFLVIFCSSALLVLIVPINKPKQWKEKPDRYIHYSTLQEKTWCPCVPSNPCFSVISNNYIALNN